MIRKQWVSLLAVGSMVCIAGCSTTPSPNAAPKMERYVHDKPTHKPPKKKVAPSLLPRVMFMVDEQSLGTIPTSEVEAIGIAHLVAEGVPIVNQDMARANMGKGQQLFKSAGDNRAAASLGSQFGADVIIIGEAVAKPSARRIADTNLRTYQAVVTLRAVRTDNARTICSASKDASAVELEDIRGSAKVLREAGEITMAQLIPDLLANWKPGHATPANTYAHRIEISVGGVDALWKVKAIRESLKGMGDTRNVTQRGYTAGLVQFSLESKLPSEELVEELVLNPPEDIRFQVLEVLPNQLQLNVSSP